MTGGLDVYHEFAYAYDESLGKRFFRAVSKLLDRMLTRYPTDDFTHLDVACGTGLALDYFAERGYRSVGIDGSLSMLHIARDRSRRLVACDMRALALRGTFSRITCLYDSLNHLLTDDDLIGAFRSIRQAMGRESLFLFDMNHPAVYPRIWGLKNPFISSDERHQLVLATAYSPLRKMGRATLSGWVRVGERKVAIDEKHQQRAFAEKEVVRALRAASLVPIEIIDFDPFDETDANMTHVKLFFVARGV